MNPKKLNLLLLIGLMMMWELSYSLPDDQYKIAELKAETAELSQKKHQGIYTGQVEFSQGSTHLEAAELLTQGDEHNKLLSVIAKGNMQYQAHYWTKTAPEKPLLHAYADLIQYNPAQHYVRLIGKAKVLQGNNSFTATEINYNTLSQHLVSHNPSNHRAIIVVHPERTTT